MQELWGKIAAWVEAHALPVGIAGLVMVLVGGVVGIAGLASGGDVAEEVPVETTAATVPPVITDTTGVVESTATSQATPDQPAEAGERIGWTAVKIDNGPSAHPQIGLADAALVFEIPVEGGLTRFLAFYPPGDAPPLVGPVRSLRPVDADLIPPFGGMVVSTGGQQSVIRSIDGAGLVRVDLETAIGFQILERPSPSNYFIDLLQVENAYPPVSIEGDGFGEGTLPGGEGAASVTIPYEGGVTWDYDGSRYLRSAGGESFDILDEYDSDLSQMSTDTVVVLFAAQRWAGFADVNGAEVPTFDVIGSGRVAVFHGGEVVEGTWFRSAQADGFRLFDASGNAMGLPDGRAFVEVLDRELDVRY